MKRFATSLRAHRANGLELVGFVMLAAGAGLVYFPAGLIVGGCCAVFAAQGVEP